MSYEFYKWLHLVSLFLLLLSMGGMLLHMMNGGTRDFAKRKILAIYHGTGSFFALVGGMGMIAKAQFAWEPWLIVKLIIWFLLSGAPALIYRRGKWAPTLWIGTIALAALAGALAIFKPI